MFTFYNSIEEPNSNQAVCLSVAAFLHALLFIWNPTILLSHWRVVKSFGNDGIVVIDVPGPVPAVTSASPAFSKPIRMRPVNGINIPMIAPKVFHPGISSVLPLPHEQILSAGPAIAVPIPLPKSGDGGVIPVHASILQQDRRGPIHSDFAIPSLEPRTTGSGIHMIIEPKAEPELATAPVSKRNRDDASGPTIEGPLSHRAVLRRSLPLYPAWAEEQGVTGTTRLYFRVDAGGKVRSDIRVTLTSGSPELDDLAIEALRRWQFSPATVPDSSQWGVITFRFSLTNRLGDVHDN